MVLFHILSIYMYYRYLNILIYIVIILKYIVYVYPLNKLTYNIYYNINHYVKTIYNNI